MKKRTIVILIGIIVLCASLYFAKDKIAFQVSLNKAYYYLDRQDNEKALYEFERLIEMAPDLYELYINKAILLAEKGDYEDALDSFRQAEELYSADSELYYNMAHLYNQMGDEEKEKECIEKATVIDFEKNISE